LSIVTVWAKWHPDIADKTGTIELNDAQKLAQQLYVVREKELGEKNRETKIIDSPGPATRRAVLQEMSITLVDVPMLIKCATGTDRTELELSHLV